MFHYTWPAPRTSFRGIQFRGWKVHSYHVVQFVLKFIYRLHLTDEEPNTNFIPDLSTWTRHLRISWWRHQIENFSALLAICAGDSPVTGEFPTQRPVTRSFDVFFDLRPNKRLSKQWWGWWFETPSSPLWRHCNDLIDEEPNTNFIPDLSPWTCHLRIYTSHENRFD